MPEFTPAEAKTLSQCVTRFTDAFRRDVADVIRREFRGYEPPEVTELIGQLSLLGRQLELRQPHVPIHDTQGPLLKRILIDLRRDSATAIEEPLQKAVNADTIRHLRREVHALEQLMAAPWFAERAPTISAGLCVADVDCFLTDREIQGRANLAKNHAKATEKGRIATYDGELFRPEDLVLA